MNDRVLSGIQVPRNHYFVGYDHPRRWTSYWVQISEALLCPTEGPILEVGVGNRLVADYLRNVAGKEVVTLDIDPELHPDVVGDILELPFDDEYFSCSMACEVLEHLPWGKALIALAELRRVSSRCIISVPDNNFEIQLRVCLGPVKRRHVSVRLPKLFRQKELRVTDEHYWELGAQGKGEDDIALALQGAGWQIEREYRNPDFLFHHFYVLRKNVDL